MRHHRIRAIDPVDVALVHGNARKRRGKLPAGNVEQDALGKPAAGGQHVGQRRGKEAAVMGAPAVETLVADTSASAPAEVVMQAHAEEAHSFAAASELATQAIATAAGYETAARQMPAPVAKLASV